MVADTPQPVRYFEYHRSRAGQVVQSMLGDDFKGVVVPIFSVPTTSIKDWATPDVWVHLA